MDSLLHDLRTAARSLRRSPGVALAAIATLALGIGGLCAIFAVIDLTLLRPLPVAHEEEMLRLREGVRQPDGSVDSVNIVGPHFQEIAAQARTLSALTAMSARAVALTSGDVPQHVEAALVSPGSLQILGIHLRAGRPFTAAEEQLGASSGVALIGEALARARFGDAASATDREIAIDGQSRRIVGVVPAWFRFPYDAELWLPVVPSAASADDYAVFARMAHGATLPQVRAELDAIAGRMPARVPGTFPGYVLTAVPMRESLLDGEQKVAMALLGVLGAFLLLACANVATLLLARSAARRKELALRAALGATRGREIRQLLLEAVLIAATGAALGIWIAMIAAPAVIQLAPGNLTQQLGLADLRFDWRVVSFALGCGALAALGAGVAPALQASRPDLNEVLKDGGGAGASAKSHRALHALVIAQTALAFALLTGGGLVIEDFRNLSRSTTGFDADHLLSAQITLPEARYRDGTRRAAFVAELQLRAAAIPGVSAAAITSVNPFGGGTWSAPMLAMGEDESAARSVNHRLITPGLLGTMRIPLLRGRDIATADGPASEKVVIVSNHLARRLWPGGDALQKQVRIARAGSPWLTVVGVAGDVLDEGDLRDAWYLPYAQKADTGAAESFWLMMRSNIQDLELPLRRMVAKIDPQLAVDRVVPMEAMRKKALARPKLGAFAVALFSGFGLLLAALGTFGVISFTIAQRRQEMGVRMALGATAPVVIRLVLRGALSMALAGECIGAVAALVLDAALRSRLTSLVGPQPLLYLAVAVVLVLAASAAALIPAWRASSVDPAEVMRAT
ncbi:MAG TPA: ADOP family duplicated permease [Myxococcales bacterium]|nr:ADOP family duplicated permease [Myxococcales bacterium]